MSQESPMSYYRKMSTFDVWRSLCIFKLCGSRSIVKNALTFIALGRKIVGDKITYALIKHSFFNHFCAGENSTEVLQTLSKLKDRNISAILAYAAESGLSDDYRSSPQSAATSTMYDLNTTHSLKTIELASQHPNNFTAIKLTALANASLLQKLSQKQQELQLFRSSSDPEISKRLSGSSASGELSVLTLLREAQLRPLFEGEQSTPLTAAESVQFGDLVKRFEDLCQASAEHKVRLLLDAEQTYLQPAIDCIGMDAMRRFNTGEGAVVYNTYQCYLQSTPSTVRTDMDTAQRENFHFGVKLVRGAYLVEEHSRAAAAGTASPLWPSKQHTDDAYNSTLDFLLSHIKPSGHQVQVLIASHNEATVKFAFDKIMQYGLERLANGGNVIQFGQLYGMCDFLTNEIASRGFQAYKYVPYGPVDEVIPYLVRRAQENSSVLSGGFKERQLLWTELLQRIGIHR
eukprot:GILK01010104.1.p1 GENE.GILK01010104.1~~GILK01010104.1.p1  ORF type:complete len:467 (+),score=53.62 GILK01010104.1:25-1401(+)